VHAKLIASAAALAASISLGLPERLAGEAPKAPASLHRATHGPRSAAKPKAVSSRQRVRRSRKKPPRIIQDASGRVVIEAVETSKSRVYGPFLPPEPQIYPQPNCEPVDAIVEIRLHEPDAYTPETTISEGDSDSGAKEVTKSASLARIAKELGSLFRPKSSEVSVRPQDVDLSDLLSQGFRIPVEGVDAERLRDSFLARRGRHAQHLAIDIGSPRGTPVVATTEGVITRVARERKGGKAIYQKDATGQYMLFYCHLSGYAEGLAPGQKVAKGEVIGYVGSTGHVIGGPHLHFSITRLPNDTDNFKHGLAINPYLLFLAEVP
jgi:murein DD-endopeptidase MepM/ murein hydrolase activator NlpD